MPTKKIDNLNFSSSIQYSGLQKEQQRLTENQRVYVPHKGFKANESDKEFIKQIKANHFEFGSNA